MVDHRWLEALAAAANGAHVIGGRLDEESLNQSDTPLRPNMPGDRLPVALGFLPFAIGANFAAWADMFQTIGHFQERYAIGNDDVEFSFRAQVAGLQLRYAPEAVVAYRHRRTAPQTFRQFLRYGTTEPLLYRTFRHYGMPRPGPLQVTKRCIALHAPLLPSPAKRGLWII